MDRRRTPLILVALILLLARPQAEAKTPPLEDTLRICARIRNPTERLACFDELARASASDAGGQAATKAAPVAPATTAAPRTATENWRKHEKGSGQTREPYAAVVTRAWESSAGDYYIALANGETWKSAAYAKVRPVKAQEEVELTPGAIGGWFMQFKTLKRPTIKVELVR